MISIRVCSKGLPFIISLVWSFFFITNTFGQCVNYGQLPIQDFDCDGITNNNDVDDDNDGILDTNEGFSTGYGRIPPSKMTASGGSLNTARPISRLIDNNALTQDFFTGPANDVSNNGAAKFAADSESEIRIISSTTSNPITITFDKTYAISKLWIHNAYGYRDSEPYTWYFKLYDANNTLLYTTSNVSDPYPYHNSSQPDVSQQNTKQIGTTTETYNRPGKASEISFTEISNVKKVEWIITKYSQSRLSANSNTLSSPDATIGYAESREFVSWGINTFTRDTDGDGNPDHMDIDSDNDKCPDAVEAGKVFEDIYLSGTSTGQLMGTVGANGLPGIAGSGLASNAAVLASNQQGPDCLYALGIIISSFDVTESGTDAEIQWNCDDESQVEFYRLSISEDGIQWRNIHERTVVHKMNGYYYYQDQEWYSNTVYYKLEVFGQDNELIDSEIRSRNPDGVKLEVVPNPSNGFFGLAGNIERGDIISVFSISGYKITERIVDETTTFYPFSESLHPGTYFIKIVSGKISKVLPLVVN